MTAVAERNGTRTVAERSDGVITPAQMLAVAVEQGADLAKLEKLMELQERWERNQARKAFDEAMSAAKAEIRPIVKNRLVDFQGRQGGKTNYAYEDFAQVAACVDPALSKYGLSYRFRSKQDGKTLTVVCVLSHRGGHCEETSLSAPNDESGNKNSIQSIGSAATYLQRYTLKLALGLSAGLDDDAQGHGRHRPAPAEPDDRDDHEPAKPQHQQPNGGPSLLMIRKELDAGLPELARLRGCTPADVEAKLIPIINTRFRVKRATFADCTAGELEYAANSVQQSLAKARAEKQAADEAGTAAAPLPAPDPHPVIDREPGIDDEDEPEPAPPPVEKGKLPKAIVDKYLAAFHDCGTSWEKVRTQALGIIGRRLTTDAHFAALSLDEADKCLEWARKLKAAAEKAKQQSEYA